MPGNSVYGQLEKGIEIADFLKVTLAETAVATDTQRVRGIRLVQRCTDELSKALGPIWIRPDKLKALVACRGWSGGHVKTRSKKVTAEGNFALAA